MAERGLEGIDETVHLTYAWIDEVAARMGSDRHHGFQALRTFLQLLRDHLPLDEAAQLAAQLPVLLRGFFYEGWDPGHNLLHERGGEEFVARFMERCAVKTIDPEKAIPAAWAVLRKHVSEGEVKDVFQSLPKGVRDLLEKS